ncbi:MAG TPA: AAA family ATPase [Nitrosospira sp.]|nr:AAA family ATPase [Nitrosospira sp.]
MTDTGHDQAEGLRRLLMQDSTRIVSVVSGGAGAGKTTSIINLAAFLAASGKNVLAIDENACTSNICATLGLSAHRDLLDVIRRDKTLAQVLISAPLGFQILPAGRGMRVLDKLNTGDQVHLIGCFAQIAQPMDIVLIDTAPGRSSRLLSLDFAGHELLVVLAPEPASITSAYSLIKHVHGYHADKQRFHILINKSSMEREAGTVFENMARAADQYLGLSLDFTGYIPTDGKLSLGLPVAEAFPDTPTAAAFREAAESLGKWSCREGESRMLERFIQRLLQNSRARRSERAQAVISGLR